MTEREFQDMVYRNASEVTAQYQQAIADLARLQAKVDQLKSQVELHQKYLKEIEGKEQQK